MFVMLVLEFFNAYSSVYYRVLKNYKSPNPGRDDAIKFIDSDFVIKLAWLCGVFLRNLIY